MSLVAVSLIALGTALAYHYGATAGTTHAYAQAAVHEPAAAPTPTPPPSVAPPISSPSDPLQVTALTNGYPKSGPGTYRYAATTGPVLGRFGPIHHFRIAIESNIKVVSMATLAAKIDSTLGDRRSWIASGQFRLQQVPPGTPSEFTIYLATPDTTNRLCAPLPVHGYTSCRQGTRVVLNLARWMTSVPYYTKAGTVLDTYHTYMINHEVGHALGHGHELCPGPGELAPVMQQQTLGLHGCRANPWPFVKGKRYDGPAGEY